MAELELYAGKLVRKTKFISIADIELEASKAKIAFTKGQAHNFRVGTPDMNRCEVNYIFFLFKSPDRTPELIADIITTRFQKTLAYYLKEIEANYSSFGLFEGYIPSGLRQAFIQYTRYLLHYFEVVPEKLDIAFLNGYRAYFYQNEFEGYDSSERDVQILNATFRELRPFEEYLFRLNNDPLSMFDVPIPSYEPKFLIPSDENGINISFNNEDSQTVIESVNYLVF